MQKRRHARIQCHPTGNSSLDDEITRLLRIVGSDKPLNRRLHAAGELQGIQTTLSRLCGEDYPWTVYDIIEQLADSGIYNHEADHVWKASRNPRLFAGMETPRKRLTNALINAPARINPLWLPTSDRTGTLKPESSGHWWNGRIVTGGRRS